VAGFFALGRRGKPAEAVADEAVEELLAFLDAPGAVDAHAADQLITLLALSPGESALTTTRITDHLLTNAEAIRQLTGRQVEIEGDPGGPGRALLRERCGG
jgi:RNA 3'-terminal phosphate cyclase (ATP)